MGIKQWFVDLLPQLSPDSVRKTDIPYPEKKSLVLVDLTGLVYHLEPAVCPREWARLVVRMLPSIDDGCRLVLCSDNDRIPLPYKHLTRSTRAKDSPYECAEGVISLNDDGMQTKDEVLTLANPDNGDRWKVGPLLAHRNTRRCLFSYLANYVSKRCKFHAQDVVIEECINEQSEFAEADILIGALVDRHLNDKSSSSSSLSSSAASERKEGADEVKKKDSSSPLCVWVRSDDSDVTAILLMRFGQQLCDDKVRIVQSRGSKYGWVDLNRAAKDIFQRHKLSVVDLLGLCAAAGNDYVDKQWCTPNVGHKHLVSRLLDCHRQVGLKPNFTYHDFTRFLGALCGGRADLITDLRKPVSLTEDSSALTKERVKTRLAAEQGVVPWDHICFLFEYWIDCRPFTDSSMPAAAATTDSAMPDSSMASVSASLND